MLCLTINRSFAKLCRTRVSLINQVYSFEDPTAGAYGNANFSYVSDYMMFEASLGSRDVLYYGETAYW